MKKFLSFLPVLGLAAFLGCPPAETPPATPATTDTPAAEVVEEETTVTEETPATTEETPATTEETPATTEEAPATTEEAPATTEEAPAEKPAE